MPDCVLEEPHTVSTALHMPFPHAEDEHGTGLSFFAHCDTACRRVKEHVIRGAGEQSMWLLQRTIFRDVDFVHKLPLQALNDRLKLYPFVDPHPFDHLLTEMMDAVVEWLQCITRPNWVAEVMHKIGNLTPEGRLNLAVSVHASRKGSTEKMGAMTAAKRAAEEDLELEQLGQFLYPIPLKLRDLQAMIRPFMELRSTHYIHGLDAIMSELIRGLLHMFHSVKAWDDALMGCVEAIARAGIVSSANRSATIADLFVTMGMDTFEALHSLLQVDAQVYPLSPEDVDTVCDLLRTKSEQIVLRGPPTSALDHHGFAPTARARVGETADRGSTFTNTPDSDNDSFEDLRTESLMWWRDQNFSCSAPTRVMANEMLGHLVNKGFHPDCHVADMFPRVLDRLFGVQMSLQAFMNRFLPNLGGYVDSSGAEIHAGCGLPLHTDAVRCASSILNFIRQWEDLVVAVDAEEAASKNRTRRSSARRGSHFDLEHFLDEVGDTGHSVHDVINMLEGAVPVPDHVVQVPEEQRRYHVDGDTSRRWELLTNTYYDLIEMVESGHRDLGPYLHLALDNPDELAKIWVNQPKQAWCLINPEVVKAALKGYSSEDADDSHIPDVLRPVKEDVSRRFGLRLVGYPQGANGSKPSTFVKFFSEEHRLISRSCLQGLPPLPWSFGCDPRNSIIVDIPESEVAPFHFLVAQSKVRPDYACLVSLCGSDFPTYIVCPKYQPLPVYNGDRIVCDQWTFELHLRQTDQMHTSSLEILTNHGDTFQVPKDGCHVGAGNRSRLNNKQPHFPHTKFALHQQLRNIAAVHMAFHYHPPMDRWTVVDHCPDPFGTLLLIRPGVAHLLSDGLRVKFGSVVLETVLNSENSC